jgi:hypothetical protein
MRTVRVLYDLGVGDPAGFKFYPISDKWCLIIETSIFEPPVLLEHRLMLIIFTIYG